MECQPQCVNHEFNMSLGKRFSLNFQSSSNGPYVKIKCLVIGEGTASLGNDIENSSRDSVLMRQIF